MKSAFSAQSSDGHPERSNRFAKRISYAVEGPLRCQLRTNPFQAFHEGSNRTNSRLQSSHPASICTIKKRRRHPERSEGSRAQHQ